ncbi:MAG: VOC family protein [Phycisphaeraceae bacterium]|nr:VOC family protein [Phycisphaeraceae bacterium]
MADNSNMPKGLVPHLVVDGAAKALEFYAKAFGAEETCRMPSPDGRLMHAEMTIGDQTIFLCDDFPEYCGGKSRTPTALGGSTVTIHRYVKDCDAAIAKAEKAGATVLMPAEDMFWGDRYGSVTDPFGHTWSFATHIKDMTPDEMAEAGKAAFGG